MILLSVLVAALFLALGAAKLLALAPMRKLAADAGFSVQAYRGIGALEVAGAAGILLGLVVPVLGGLAGTGLLLLLAGALITHVRNRDGLRALAPAVVCALLVGAYLLVLVS